MGDYQSLLVWQRAHELTVMLYRETENFPDSERYGLTSQMRRVSASIGCNLAEGSGRNTDREFRRSCRIALGSANEVHYQLLLARDLGILSTDRHNVLNDRVMEVKRMLAALANALSA